MMAYCILINYFEKLYSDQIKKTSNKGKGQSQGQKLNSISRSTQSQACKNKDILFTT